MLAYPDRREPPTAAAGTPSRLASETPSVRTVEPPTRLPFRPSTVPSDRRFTLDLDRLGRQRHLVPRNLRTPLAREISTVKRSLDRAVEQRRDARPERSTLVLVTSTNPREGKSFLSLNLGLHYAFSDSRPVLFVDADTIARGLSRYLGVAERPGLAEHVPARMPLLEECLLQADREALSVLPAGAMAAASTDWTRRDCEQLALGLRRLAPDNAVIVVDTAPLSALPTAQLLGDYVDHVLFVVGAGQTKPDQIALALAQIGNQETVSFVLNRASIAPNADGLRVQGGVAKPAVRASAPPGRIRGSSPAGPKRVAGDPGDAAEASW